MKKDKLLRTILISAFVLLLQTGFSQDLSLNLKSKNEILDFEKANNGIFKDSIKSFGILENPQFDIYTLFYTKVWIFKRVEDSFDPQLHLWYYFDKKADTLKAISYYWGLYNPSFSPTRTNLYPLTFKEDEFKKKYRQLRKKIIEKFGKPNSKDKITNNSYTLAKSEFWEDDQKVVQLSIRFDRILRDAPNEFTTSNFYIRAMITYK